MVKFVITKTENKPKIYSSEFKNQENLPRCEDTEVKAFADALGKSWSTNMDKQYPNFIHFILSYSEETKKATEV